MKQRWFFVHLLETGGTPLYFMLLRQFAKTDIFPAPASNNLITIDAVAARTEFMSTHSEHSLVAGHFPLACADGAAQPWTTFTLLGHPFLRVLANLHRQSSHNDSQTMESLYNNPMQFQMFFNNHMVKMLGLAPEEADGGMFSPVQPDRQHLERAKKALETLDVLGVQEDFEPFCRRMEQAYGWDLGERLSVAQPTLDSVPEGLMERIQQDNQLDLELYSHARELLGLPPLPSLG